MSLSCLNNDVLIKIIQNITEEKNDEIKKLEEKLETANNANYEYEEALHRTGREFYTCWKCKSCVIDLDEEDFEEECFQIRDNEYICCNCMEKINNNVDIQNEIMENFTEYTVRVSNERYWYSNTNLKYKTYEEIPMCYKNSNMCIEKEYYTDWEKFKQDEKPEKKIMNGDIKYSIKHSKMLEELDEVYNMNEIYCWYYNFKKKLGWNYNYKLYPIKTLLNVNWCSPKKCEPRDMIGRSWWKCEGYNSACDCAYKSLTEKYKTKYLDN